MKLSTLVFPTGEFALIASEFSVSPTQSIRQGLIEFRKLIGANAVFITDQVVEVDNALVDSEVVRTPPPRVLEQAAANLAPTGIKVFRAGEVIASIGSSGDAHFHGAPIIGGSFYVNPEALTQGTLSPAGLVKDGPKEPVPADQWRGGEPGSDPEPDGVLADAGWDSSPDYKPKVGDRVRIKIVNGYRIDENEHHGKIGEVIRLDEKAGDEGEDVVVVRREDSTPWSGRAIYCLEVEFVGPKPYEPAVGDHVRVVEVHPEYDQRRKGLVGTIERQNASGWVVEFDPETSPYPAGYKVAATKVEPA